MVNVNSFGARGVNPQSMRQLAMACKAQGLVLDKETGQCRESRRGAGLAAARTSRAMNRALAGPTQKDMAAMCKAQGLVFDRETKQCRARKQRASALEAAYARGSLFFGARGVNPQSMRQLAMACKAQGLVLDKETGQCRESRRGAGLAAARTSRAMNRALAGPTQKDMAAMCKAQGLVFDRETKQCRARKQRASALEAAYARGSLFFGNKFGVMAPASAQRAGVVYHSPASSLRGDYYPMIGPVSGRVTGPASFDLRPSSLSSSAQKKYGIELPKRGVPRNPKKVAPKKAARKNGFGRRFGEVGVMGAPIHR